MTQARTYGFTLIELMVAVVILAIIVGIAYPSYRNYMVQTRRSDAQSILTQVTNNQEKFFSNCNRYTTTMAGLISTWACSRPCFHLLWEESPKSGAPTSSGPSRCPGGSTCSPR